MIRLLYTEEEVAEASLRARLAFSIRYFEVNGFLLPSRVGRKWWPYVTYEAARRELSESVREEA